MPGGALLGITLGITLHAARHAVSRLAGWAYPCVLVVLLVSDPIGVVLAYLRDTATHTAHAGSTRSP
jgi:hypothetical protein